MLCSCDGPPHPHDPGRWCPPAPVGRHGHAAVTAPSVRGREHDELIADAQTWLAKLESDGDWAHPHSLREENRRNAGILRRLIARAR